MATIDRNSLFLSMKRLASLISLAEDAMGVDRSLIPLETLPRLTQPDGDDEAVRELWDARRRSYLQEYRATARYLVVPVHILPRLPRDSHGVDNRAAHHPGCDPRVAHEQRVRGGDNGRD